MGLAPGPDDSDVSEKRRKILKGLGAAGAAGAFAGCSGGPEDTPTDTSNTPSATPEPVTDTPTPDTNWAEVPKGGTFIYGTTSTSRALNALRLGDGSTSDRVHNLVDYGFLRDGPEYENVTPYLFEDFTVSDDLTSMTITLRDNLEFGNDYGAVTADDYLWTLRNIWNVDWFPFTYQYTFSVGADNTPIEFEKVDKYTIKQSIPEPRPFFPYSEPLGGYIPIPQELGQPYVDEEDVEGLFQDDEIVRTQFNGNLGPWDLDRYSEQSVVVFDRADDYYLREVAESDDNVPDAYGEAPFFDQYKIQHFSRDSTIRQALKAGEIDYAGIPPTKTGSFEDREGVKLYENPFVAYSNYLGMNHRANGWEGMQNKKVRHAFANLYDREFVVKNIMNGRGGVQRTLYPTWGPYYPEGGVRSHEGTVSKAKELLKEGTSSDYGYNGSGEFVDGDGEQVELTMVYVSGTQDDLRASYTIQRFEKAGIAINEQTTSWASLLTTYFYTNQPAEGVGADEPIGYGDDGQTHPSVYNYGPRDKAVSPKDWDLMNTLGFSYGPLDPAGTMEALFGEEATFNAYGYKPSKSIADLTDKAKSAPSREEARSTIQEIMTLLAEEQPVVYESNPYSYGGYNDRAKNLPESPAANYYVDQNWDTMYFEDGENGR